MDKVKQMRKLTKMVSQGKAEVRPVLDNKGMLIYAVIPLRNNPPARASNQKPQ